MYSLLIAGLIVGQAKIEAQPPQKLSQTAVLFNTAALWNAYDENQAAADQKYTGQIIEIQYASGKVQKSPDGRYFIAHYQYSPNPPRMTPSAYCYVTPASAGKLALPKGTLQAFHIRGKCLGRSDDETAYKRVRITLEECEVIAAYEWSKNKWVEVIERK